MLPFSDKIILVTGASRGLGRATALELGKQGAHVVLMARTVSELETLSDEIQDAGGQATIVPCDLADLNAVDTLGVAILQKFGRLDGLVANAAMLGTLTPVSHAKPDAWDKVITLNLTANFRLIRAVDGVLKAAPKASAVFVSSRAATSPRAYWHAYAASKAGLEALVKSYAAELEKTNVSVHIFDPGVMRTAMRAQAFPGEDKEKQTPPEDVAKKLIALLG